MRVERNQTEGTWPELWLAPSPFSSMIEEAARWADKETGGMLLGYRAHRQIVVQSLIGPGPRALHGRFTFRPDGLWQEAELARTYDSSGRMLMYLGDWHSHPGGGLRPSKRDLHTARLVAATPAAGTREPVTLILATTDRAWRPAAWILDRGLFLRARIHGVVPNARHEGEFGRL